MPTSVSITALLVIALSGSHCTHVLLSQQSDRADKRFARPDIRKSDFANRYYTIPDRDSESVPTFGALNKLTGTVVKLKNGIYQVPSHVADQDWVGITLYQVSYGDVTGDNREEALVALRMQTAGTLSWGLLLIYGWDREQLDLLQVFWTGDRANEGLHRAYAEGGRLAVEIYDPQGAEGDCCATRITKIRLRWAGGRFIEVDRQSSGLLSSR